MAGEREKRSPLVGRLPSTGAASYCGSANVRMLAMGAAMRLRPNVFRLARVQTPPAMRNLTKFTKNLRLCRLAPPPLDYTPWQLKTTGHVKPYVVKNPTDRELKTR